MNGQIIKDEFDQNVNAFITGVVIHQGTVVGVLKKACRSDSDYRLVLKVLTGKTSSKELSPAQWHALYKLVLPYKPEGGKWGTQHGEEVLQWMCDSLVRMTLEHPGQMKLPI